MVGRRRRTRRWSNEAATQMKAGTGCGKRRTGAEVANYGGGRNDNRWGVGWGKSGVGWGREGIPVQWTGRFYVSARRRAKGRARGAYGSLREPTGVPGADASCTGGARLAFPLGAWRCRCGHEPVRGCERRTGLARRWNPVCTHSHSAEYGDGERGVHGSGSLCGSIVSVCGQSSSVRKRVCGREEWAAAGCTDGTPRGRVPARARPCLSRATFLAVASDQESCGARSQDAMRLQAMGARTSLLSPPVLVVERRHRASPASRPLAQGGGGRGACTEPCDKSVKTFIPVASESVAGVGVCGPIRTPPATSLGRMRTKIDGSHATRGAWENHPHPRPFDSHRAASLLSSRKMNSTIVVPPFRCNQSCCCRTHILLVALSLDCGSADRRRPTCHMYQRQSQWPSQLQSARTELAVFASAWA
ncbi:hypothetical protein L1887_48471 [Cichorium endivia]|nr:hypothetical protein L1887_48471 [Cichorium endivia]